MAFITAETRSDLIELSVAMLKQAPSAALLASGHRSAPRFC